jgi:mRNA-degrading endonuclease RelE of RelBE toxin-antitoxin system
MAERIKTYQFSRRFKREYLSLPKEVQQAFDEKLKLFLQDVSHPSLRVRKSNTPKTPNFKADLAHKKYSLYGSASPNSSDQTG